MAYQIPPPKRHIKTEPPNDNSIITPKRQMKHNWIADKGASTLAADQGGGRFLMSEVPLCAPLSIDGARGVPVLGLRVYRGTSLLRNRHPP